MRIKKNHPVTPLFFAVLLFVYPAIVALAQYGDTSASRTSSSSESYVPLIGITSVPDPIALPSGPGIVTFRYAVKNFLREAPLTDVSVVDDQCSRVSFVEGDDNGNGKLDYDETWRYSCTTKVSTTTQSTATVVGTANHQVATHNAYATVVVGSNMPPPLISIINITKIAYPLSLPAGGGSVTFTYKVNNPGVVPLENVTITDDKCSAMSNRLGDTNNNNLLDVTEVWIYTCRTVLVRTTTNTVRVMASANGLKATSQATITVTVKTPGIPGKAESSGSPPSSLLLEAGNNPDLKLVIWAISGAVLILLFLYYRFIQFIRKNKLRKKYG